MIEGDALDRHAARVRQELELLDYPRRPWMPGSGGGQPGKAGRYDVVIVGAGQGGLAAAFGLARERVTNLLVVDDNPLDRAGPWLNFARMRTLRTPKYLTGPDLGIPSLTPRAWYEAQHGAGSWEALGLMPKETWAEYLALVPAHAAASRCAPDTRVGALRWNAREARVGGAVRRRARGAARPTAARAARRAGDRHRRLGPAGSARRMIRDALPRAAVRAHARGHRLRGAARQARRRAGRGRLGLRQRGDRARARRARGAALLPPPEPGQRQRLPLGRVRRASCSHLGDLPDADKWRFILQILRMGQLPPADTLRRARAAPRLPPARRLARGSAVEARGDAVIIARRDDGRATLRGRLRHRRHRLRHRPGAAARARAASSPTSPAGRTAISRRPATSATRTLLRHPYLGPGLRVHRAARRARRRDLRTSTTTRSAAC